MNQTPPDTPDLLDAEPGDNQPPVLSVGELSGAVKRTVEDSFGYVRVRGEVSGFKRAASGHLYMTLKDADAMIDGVCWRGSAGRLEVQPEDGLEVIATGRVTTYPARSKYQLVIERLEVAGEGALLKMIEERRKRLAAEGLFEAERKADIPYLPEVIGVVTSPTGAVIRDILHRLADRFPRHVLVWPVLVQGDNAAAQITAAIEGFNRLTPDGPVPRPDLLIVARGGGSLEDLMAFNEENVVRAAAGSEIPLISAVGHETDTTLIDFASDKRAPTPTAAAEMAVPVRSDLIAQVGEDGARLTGAITRLVRSRNQEVTALGRGLPAPRRILEGAMQRVDDWAERLHPALTRVMRSKDEAVTAQGRQLVQPDQYVEAKRRDLASMVARLAAVKSAGDGRIERDLRDTRSFGQRLDQAAGRVLATAGQKISGLDSLLESYSYKGVLERGFVLVRDAGGAPVLAADALTPGDGISLSFRDDGVVGATVDSVGGDGPAARPAKPRKPKPAAAAKKKPAKKDPNDDPQGSLL
ncbi:MAG: exodeoxyribonuclease VII large subunit [Rhodospirillaceae bacterium]|jgi:exodeoxyribonuclease VII large subunit|nr:exodeoxyribonuclease VII large subunit [Rhodospirillaceae bacterium]MBT5945249.1 exodeoxyribonuclease VII large subunit [Rhodospirillaceae bacterium]MBT6405775.1 exodeoxyribonuclease VII large subunit [Rhodospirillaceae bacterium]MBT7361494.1 exodeoxyribonuclease VII large subunit [Rhodospirillaceae bacterium]